MPNWTDLYLQLGKLIEEMPNLESAPRGDTVTLRWYGRAHALVKQVSSVDAIFLKSAVDNLYSVLHPEKLHQIRAVVYRALATAEANAEPGVRGTFVPAQSPFDALAAISKVLSSAGKSVRIVDPYMDAQTLTEYVPLAPANVAIELLADSEYVKAGLSPAVRAWQKQHGGTRNLQARLSAARALHDRFIVVDTAQVWLLSQSLNALAARSPATVVRADPEVAAMKIAAYEAIWQAATPVT